MYFYSFGILGESAIGTSPSVGDISAIINTSSVVTSGIRDSGTPFISSTISCSSTTAGTIIDISGNNPLTWTDGVDTFRLNIRSDELYLDQVLSDTGFSGSSPGDWDSIWIK